jgi:hypothetical protein
VVEGGRLVGMVDRTHILGAMAGTLAGHEA